MTRSDVADLARALRGLRRGLVDVARGIRRGPRFAPGTPRLPRQLPSVDPPDVSRLERLTDLAERAPPSEGASYVLLHPPHAPPTGVLPPLRGTAAETGSSGPVARRAA